MTDTIDTAKQKQGYHWLIVLSSVFFGIGTTGIVFNAAGLFFVPVSTALGFGIGELSPYITFMMLTATVVLPFAGRIMTKADIRVTHSLGAVCLAVPIFCMGFFTQPWMFYMAGVVMGFGVAFSCYLTVPTLINRWFKKRIGLAMGISMAFTGIGGIIFNTLGAQWIVAFGYEITYHLFGIAVLVCVLPFSIFVIRSNPSEKGLLPYGEADEALGTETKKQDGSLDKLSMSHSHQVADAAKAQSLLTGISSGKAMRMTVFYAVALFAGIAAIISGIQQFIPAFATSLPWVVEATVLSGMLASFVLVGQVTGKLTLGYFLDKSKIACIVGIVILGVTGLSLLWLLPVSQGVVLGAAVLYGIFNASPNLVVTIMTRSAFGARDYTKIYSRVSMVSTLCAAIAATALGLIVQLTGGYDGLWIIGISGLLVCLCLGSFVFTKAKKLISEHTTE